MSPRPTASPAPVVSLPNGGGTTSQVLEAQALAHRAEVNKLAMQLLLYRTALEEAGIDPPDASAEDLLEMWRRCMAIVQHANEFVTGLGSAKELLEAWS